MERRKTSFESHLNIIEAGQNKTASHGGVSGDSLSLLDKLAAELGMEDSATAAAAPVAEGQVFPAESTVAGASPVITGATDAVIVPQTAIAGGNEAEAQAGEIPAPVKPNQGVVISAGDGVVTDANQMHRTPAAVASAADDAGGAMAEAMSEAAEGELDEKTASEANAIGKRIAESFQAQLEKIAIDNQYAQSMQYLADNGLLEGYDIKDVSGFDKIASEIPEGSLEKLANGQALTKHEVIAAAMELSELQKEAAYEELAGREDAHKVAAQIEKQARYDARQYIRELQKEAEYQYDEEASQEKVAELMQDREIMAAVQVLKNKGLIG